MTISPDNNPFRDIADRLDATTQPKQGPKQDTSLLRSVIETIINVLSEASEWVTKTHDRDKNIHPKIAELKNKCKILEKNTQSFTRENLTLAKQAIVDAKNVLKDVKSNVAYPENLAELERLEKKIEVQATNINKFETADIKEKNTPQTKEALASLEVSLNKLLKKYKPQLSKGSALQSLYDLVDPKNKKLREETPLKQHVSEVKEAVESILEDIKNKKVALKTEDQNEFKDILTTIDNLEKSQETKKDAQYDAAIKKNRGEEKIGRSLMFDEKKAALQAKLGSGETKLAAGANRKAIEQGLKELIKSLKGYDEKTSSLFKSGKNQSLVKAAKMTSADRQKMSDAEFFSFAKKIHEDLRIAYEYSDVEAVEGEDTWRSLGTKLKNLEANLEGTSNSTVGDNVSKLVKGRKIEKSNKEASKVKTQEKKERMSTHEATKAEQIAAKAKHNAAKAKFVKELQTVVGRVKADKKVLENLNTPKSKTERLVGLVRTAPKHARDHVKEYLATDLSSLHTKQLKEFKTEFEKEMSKIYMEVYEEIPEHVFDGASEHYEERYPNG